MEGQCLDRRGMAWQSWFGASGPGPVEPGAAVKARRSGVCFVLARPSEARQSRHVRSGRDRVWIGAARQARRLFLFHFPFERQAR